MRYVVAGVTGRVGSVVAAELIARGARPAVIVRAEPGGAEWRRRSAEVAVGSLDDNAFVARVLRGAAGFFVLLPENVAPRAFHAARRRMADAIAAAIEASGVPHVVLLSATAATLADGNGPAKDLHYFEQRLGNCGTRLTVLRACYFQDNVASVVDAAATAGIYPNLLPPADMARPMIATKDVGRFAAHALVTPPARSEVVDLLGPAYSARAIAQRLGAALGRTLQVVDVQADERVPALERAGVPRQLAEAVAELLEAAEAGRIVPAGDRLLRGTTVIDEVIADCLEAGRARERSA
jgi:uncharacterized protein YbjT (DUF2867 family)